MLPTVEQTCQGKTSDGSQCPFLLPKLGKDKKEDEPAMCINCGHFDTSHLQEGILQQPPSTSSSSFSSIMSKYSHLLSKTGASEEVSHRETNGRFRKQDLALSASTSHMTKVSSSKDAKKKTAANLRKAGIGSIVMVTCEYLNSLCPPKTRIDINDYFYENRKGCMKQKLAPDTAKTEGLRKLKLAVSKGPDDEDLQIAPNMTKNRHIANKNSDSTYWYLIVKSGKDMVKSSQEGLTGNKVLKTRHPAGRKWTDQFIYFGTVLDVDPDSFDDSMSEVECLEDGKAVMVRSDDMDESEPEVPLPKGKDFNLKKRTRSASTKLFATSLDSDSDDSEVVVVEDHERTERPQRKRRVMWRLESLETLGLDDVQPAEDEQTSNTQLGLPEESSAPDIQDKYNYEPYNTIDFGASVPSEDILPSTSVLAATSLTAAVSSSTHELGSGLPQNLHAVHNNTPRFLSSCSGFNMLVKTKQSTTPGIGNEVIHYFRCFSDTLHLNLSYNHVIGLQ
ncbi:hypothetical protein F4604DRAFT_1933304 [Suillus subluteus]|nr:hypothetical protein F4604DRAFT_1933304 [Suillus subluteus]